MYLCGIYYLDNCMFRKGMTSLYAMTSTVWIEHTTKTTFRIYLDWMRQRECDGVKHDALVLEHMLINRSIHTGRAAL